jgi:beta-lactam-binding protein with PASTA domain
MSLRLHGAGIVVGQEPAAGSAVQPGAVATLILERRVSMGVDPRSPRESVQ